MTASWSASTGATGYKFERSDDGGNTWAQLGSNLAANATSATDATVAQTTAYTYRVIAINAAGDSAPSASLAVTTLPTAPSNLLQTGSDSTSVTLAWTDHSTGETGFTIQRQQGGSWVTAGHVGANVTAFTDTALVSVTTYTYRVVADNGAAASAPSATATASTGPAAVTSFSVTPIPNDISEIDLAWSAVSGADHYIVYRNEGHGWVVQNNAIPANSPSYNDTNTTGNTQYAYRVVAVSAAGELGTAVDYSTASLPTPPQGLSASAVSASRVDISWNNDPSADSYVLERAIGNGPFDALATPAGNAASYSDTTVAAGTVYTYRLAGVTLSGQSGFTAAGSVTTQPGPVTNLTATTTPQGVHLTWAAPLGATGFTVYASTNGGTTYDAGHAAGLATSYDATGLTEGTSYTFKVVASDGSGDSAGSPTVAALTAPSAPNTLVATPVSAGEIDLTFTNTSGNATGFQVLRRPSGSGSYAQVGSDLAANAVGFNDMTVAAGTAYDYEVVAFNGGGNGLPSTSVTATSIPAAPANLAFTVVSNARVDLSWDAVTGATAYRLYRADGGGIFHQVGGDIVGGAHAYSDTGLSSATQYDYEVTAVNGSGESAVASTPDLWTLPDAPANFTATPQSAGEVDLAWDATGGARGYTITRSTDNWVTSTAVATNTQGTTYHDVSTSGGVNYKYRIVALNDTGASAASDVTATTVPATPANLVVTSVTAGAVNLSWDGAIGATAYLVERNDGGGWSTLDHTAAGVTVYHDNTAAAGTTYTYRVTAEDTTGDGIAATVGATTLPAQPRNLAATPASATHIDVAWDAVTGATQYVLQRKIGAGAFADLTTVNAPAVSYADTTVVGGTQYSYRVKAVDASGESAWSATAAATTVPAAVSDLAATPTSAVTTHVTWSAVTGATGYTIYISSDNGGTFDAGTDVGTAVTYNGSGLTEATAYVYKVVARDTTGNAADSNLANVSTLPAAPSTVAATLNSASEVDLSWVNVSANQTGVKVYRATGAGSPTQLGSTLAANAISFHDTTVASGTAYTYTIVAAGTGGDSASTGTLSVTTVPAAPTNVVATASSDAATHVTWAASAGATGYTLYRSVNGGAFSAVSHPGASDVSYDDSALTEATGYTYKLIATDGGGDSALSSTSTATTLPAKPTGLSSDQLSQTSLRLYWTDNSAAETGYRIEQYDSVGQRWSAIGGDQAAVASSGGTGFYTVSGLTEATQYRFRVKAFNSTGESVASDPLTISTLANEPTHLAASATSATSVHVTWADNSANEDGYPLLRSTDGVNWTLVYVGGPNTTSYDDTAVLEGTTYEYEVASIKGGASSNSAGPVTVTTLPAGATSLTATASAPTHVALAWTDNSSGETGFRVEHSTDNGVTWSTLTTLAANTTSYTDTAAAESATTKYRVFALNTTGDGAVSNAASATTPVAAPSAVTVNATSDTATHVQWTNNSTVQTSFKIERSADGGGTWSVVATPAANATSWNDSGLTENVTYAYRVSAVAGGATSPASGSASALTPLSPPTGLAVTGKTDTSVSLGWTNVSAAASTVRIERSPVGGGNWQEIGFVTASHTTYTDATAAEGTDYNYRIRTAGGGNASVYNGPVNVTTPPTAASALTAARTTPFSTTTIDLTWLDNSAVETGYDVSRSSDGGQTWTDLTVVHLAAGATSYEDTTGVEGTDYVYRVDAIGAGGASADATASATTAPAAPTGLSATGVSAGRVDLAWTDHSGNATSYEVQRSLDGNSWTTLASDVNTIEGGYTDTSVSEGTAYHYRVAALHAHGGTVLSDFSNTADVTTVPAAPATTTTTNPSAGRVVITWTDSSNGETGYHVERAIGAGSFTVLTTTGANATTYSDNTVTEGTTYTYRVQAYNTGGTSLYGPTSTVTTSPTSPTALTAAAGSSTQINLSWTNRSTQATGVKIERSTNGGSTWAQIDTVAAGVATYADTTVHEAASYQYRIRAYETVGGVAYNSGYTSSAAATTPLNDPTNLVVTATSGNQVVVTWTDNSSAETAYKVERSTDGTTWTVFTAAANATTYTDSTAAAGTTYIYRVKASKSGNASAYVTAPAVTTRPTDPSALTATAASATQINLAWTAGSGQSAFTVERSTDSGVTWTVLTAAVAANATSYSDTTASEETTYTYRVKATNAAGNSGYATSSAVTSLPAAPSGLGAVASAPDQVNLSWTNNSTRATGFKVERSDNGGAYVQVGTVAANVTTFTDPTVSEASSYAYRVRANDGGRNSVYSNAAAVVSLPLAPDTLVASPVSTTAINLAWNDNSTGATAYRVERSVDGGTTFTEIATLNAGNANSYHDTGLSEGTDYQYRVRAVNSAGGFSDYTPSADAVTLPATPTALATAAVNGQINLTWTDNSNGEDGYKVERSTNGVNFTEIADIGPDSASYSDTNVTNGTSYTYRVRAYDAGGFSAYSDTSTRVAIVV